MSKIQIVTIFAINVPVMSNPVLLTLVSSISFVVVLFGVQLSFLSSPLCIPGISMYVPLVVDASRSVSSVVKVELI